MAGLNKHLEDDEAKALWQWAQHVPTLRDYLFAVPNGGRRNAREAARMKGMGVRAGVSDFMIPVPRGMFMGLFLELKAGKNKMTAEQKEWLFKIRMQGYAGYCATGFEQARDVLSWYIALPIPDMQFEQPPIEAIMANRYAQ